MPGGWIDFLIFFLILVSLVAAPVFVGLLRAGALRLAGGCVLAMLLLGGVNAVLVGTRHWTSGAGLCLVWWLIAGFSFFFLATRAVATFRSLPGQRWQHGLYLVGGLLIVAGQLFPLAGGLIVEGVCSGLSEPRSGGVIKAVEDYQRDQGAYPAELEMLVPAYLPALPPAACGQSYSLVRCPTGKTLLVFSSVDGLGNHFYDFATGEWRVIDALDFWVCAPPEE